MYVTCAACFLFLVGISHLKELLGTTTGIAILRFHGEYGPLLFSHLIIAYIVYLNTIYRITALLIYPFIDRDLLIAINEMA